MSKETLNWIIFSGLLFLGLIILILSIRKSTRKTTKKHSSKSASHSKDDKHAHGDEKSSHDSHDEGHGDHDQHHGSHGGVELADLGFILGLGVLLFFLFLAGYGGWNLFFKKDKPAKTKTERVETLPSSFTRTYYLSKENLMEKIEIPINYNYSIKSSGNEYWFKTNKTENVLVGGNNKPIDIRKIEVRIVTISFYEKDVNITFTFTRK